MTFKNRWSIYGQSLKILWQTDKKTVFLSLIVSFIEALPVIFGVVLLAQVVAGLSAGLPFQAVFLRTLFWSALIFLLELLKSGDAYKTYLLENLSLKLKRNICEKSLTMDFETLEHPSTYNLYREMEERQNFTGRGILSFAYSLLSYTTESFFTLLITGVSFVVFFFKNTPDAAHAGMNYVPWNLLVLGTLILTLISGAYGLLKILDYEGKMIEEVTPGSRFGSYVMNQVLNYQKTKSLRLFNQTPSFLSEIRRVLKSYQTIAEKTGILLGQAGIFFGLGDFILLAALLIACGIKVQTGAITLSEMVYYLGLYRLFNSSGIMFVQGVARTYALTPELALYQQYLALPDPKSQTHIPIEKRQDRAYALSLRDVSFTYPNTNREALHHLSLDLPMGKKIAIVGENGSGKTTFIKLLTRLYDPSEGEIRLNGFDIKKYDYEEYRSLFSVVFQDFKLFCLPLDENVACSKEVDSMRCKRALEEAGFDFAKHNLAQGLKTYLYKDFSENGVELSGGEAQKIALARALCKDSPILILDEPTAALDPLSEMALYERFSEITGDRLALYISHRLASCRFCDEILVFKQGRIVQRGTHERLLADAKGHYYKLWHAQASYYEKSPKQDSTPSGLTKMPHLEDSGVIQ
ncbi:hypothetical protein ABB02_01548 [Clostridiaceae bacterium JG1575]|nr:hypothetical protein ABB02_01548 [Clostridiaceae bacterium JG1575]